MNKIADLLGDFESVSRIIFLTLVFVEWIILAIFKKIESHKEGVVSLLSFMIDLIPYTIFGNALIFAFMTWIHQFRIYTFGHNWYDWLLCLLLYDLIFYATHYIGHRVRFFWCIHGVHHTAEEMKVTVTVRGSFLGILYTPHNIIWLPLLGFDPILVLIIYYIGSVYSFFSHLSEDIVNKEPSWLGKIFVTPSVHRVHHSKNHVYLDRNYGETFSIWDRIFGTFQKELDDENPEYGIMDDRINSESLWQIQTLLWKDLWNDVKNAPTFLDKVKYLIMPPGWNHIDGGKLSDQYRSEALAKRK